MKLVYTEQALVSLEETLEFYATKLIIYVTDIFDSRQDPDKMKE